MDKKPGRIWQGQAQEYGRISRIAFMNKHVKFESLKSGSIL